MTIFHCFYVFLKVPQQKIAIKTLNSFLYTDVKINLRKATLDFNLLWWTVVTVPRSEEAGLDPGVGPEALHDHPQLVAQLPVLPRRRRHREKLSSIVLK